MKWECYNCGHSYISEKPVAFCGECGKQGTQYAQIVPAGEGTRVVTMVRFGDDKIRVIQEVMKFSELRLAEAKELVESCPVSMQLAQPQINALLSAGAVLVEEPEATKKALDSLLPAQVEDRPNADHEPQKQERVSTVVPAGSWGDWTKLPASHKQAMTAIQALKAHSDSFRMELVAARKEWTEAKDRSQKTHDSVATSARTQCEDTCKKAATECEKGVKETEQRNVAVGAVVNACATFLEGLYGYTRSTAEDHMKEIQDQQAEVVKAIESKVQAYRELRELKVGEAERVLSDKLDRARKEQIERDSQSELAFKSKSEEICKRHSAGIEKGFSKEAIRAYKQRVEHSRFNAEHYECPSMLPDSIMLGDIGLIIPNQSSDDMSVIQAVDLQTSDVGTKLARDYIVQMPYAQRLTEGVSLMMRYSPKDRTYVQGLIQPLLLKMFMSIPAGRLEATMIDPLELGASFPDIPRLGSGPNSSRIIDTKIWSKEKDIERAVSTLRQWMEELTQSFGGDQESRYRKEVIKALAITDFPVGFNETALKDLHAIVRNSASLGVLTFICANEEELEKLRQRHGNLVDEIAQSLIETRADGKRLMLTGGEGKIFLEIDEMADVMERKDEILSILCGAIDSGRGGLDRVEPFDAMFKGDIYDSNTWFQGNQDEISIPIGIKGADSVIRMVLGRGGGSTEHHALVAGQTGAGKSTFFHTLIMSTLISYSPEEVQMYLLDFKEGVEFNIYTHYRLPSLRVVALNSEREFGLNVLKELCEELETRSKQFSWYGASDINGYLRLPDVPKVPKLLLIFDEVQELFRSGSESDTISAECLSCLKKLVMQGRAMGIHIILACQDFRNCSGLEALFSQMAIRVAIKGDPEGASSILGQDNKAINNLQKNRSAGAAVYNNRNGEESANNLFQISYFEEEGRLKLLALMGEYFSDSVHGDKYDEMITRVLLTNVEDNINNSFNRLMQEGAKSIEPMGEQEDGYGLMLGQGFGKRSVFVPELKRRDGDNVLVVTRNEKTALSLFELSTLSVLYEELRTNADKDNALVYIADYSSDGELSATDCSFQYLADKFDGQVISARIRDDDAEVERLISDLYEIVVGRSEGRFPSKERLFFLFFGINRARKLLGTKMYDDAGAGEHSPMEMLQIILRNGPKVGVNCIVWGESVRGIEMALGDRYDALFDKRIAYDLDADAFEALVAESNPKSLHGRTAVYMDISRDPKNTHFRPYEVLSKVWVESFADVYEQIVAEGGNEDE